MKKLILGLFLTVGISGVALAGNGNNSESSSSITCNEVNTINNTADEDVKLNCATSYFVKSYNCDGSSDIIASGYYSHDCAPGQPEGELTMTIIRTTGSPDCGPN